LKLTTSLSASLALQGEVERGNINAAPKAPLREAPAGGLAFFTAEL